MYLRTDEELETVDAIRMALRFAEEVRCDNTRWKWVIIALHNATQGMMVLALKRKDRANVFSRNDADKVRVARETRSLPPPDPYLDKFINLYDKVKLIRGAGSYFLSPELDADDLKRLNDIRNVFIHFTPKSWSLELAGLPRFCLVATRLIAFLGWETDSVFWYSDQAAADAREATIRLSHLLHCLANE